MWKRGAARTAGGSPYEHPIFENITVLFLEPDA